MFSNDPASLEMNNEQYLKNQQPPIRSSQKLLQDQKQQQ